MLRDGRQFEADDRRGRAPVPGAREGRGAAGELRRAAQSYFLIGLFSGRDL